MKNKFYDVDREWDASFYDDEISFQMEDGSLNNQVYFTTDDSDEDEEDESADPDWGMVDPLEDGTPSDTDPSGPGSAV